MATVRNLPAGRGQRTPPHNIEAERSLLGALLLDRHAIDRVIGNGLTADCFYKPVHQSVYDAIRRLAGDGHPVDAVTIAEQLRRSDLIDPQTVVDLILELQSATPAVSHVERYAGIVKDAAHQRRMISTAAEIAEIAYDQAPDADARMAEVLERLDLARARDGRYSTWQHIDLTAAATGAIPRIIPQVFARTDGNCLLYLGRVHGFNGEPESCKTWAAYCAAAQQLTAGNPVWWIDLEDDELLAVERLRSLGVPADAIIDRFRYIHPSVAMSPGDRHLIRRALASDVPNLVVFDSVVELMALHGLDPYKPQDVAQMHGIARLFAEAGAAVVLIDHVVKDTETRGRWATGSERKLGGIDGATYTFDAIAPFGHERTGRIKVTVTKDRSGRVRGIAAGGHIVGMLELTSWPDEGVTWRLEPAAERDGGFRPTHLMERISKAIEQTPGLTAKALRGAVSGRGTSVDLAIELLVAEGWVRVDPGSRGAKLHHSERPYREADDTPGDPSPSPQEPF